MITIKHESLAEFIKNYEANADKQPEQFPDQNERVCPDCGTRYPGNRTICSIEGTVLVQPMQRLGQPLVLLEALKESELAQRYVARAYLGMGLLCSGFEGLSIETVEPVAIKVLRHELADDKKTNARFVIEAQMWQALKHRNIASVLETGLIPELVARATSEQIPWKKDIAYDRPYIVMEHLKGINLKTVLQGYGPLGCELTMRIAVNVLEGLHCAHKQEIVHRDLKPSNIFLLPDEAGRIEVKVSDFGLAARMFRQTEWTPQTTKTGSVYGDPSYLSPEYLIEQKTSARSDIYALGCIMYECISGKSPFAGQHEFHTMIRHVKDRPDALPKHLEVPELLEKTIYRAINKEPSSRFDSAEHMHAHLGTLLTGVHAG
ncbi:MAG: serine/threonine protein kinase [Candidatus Melainabacteria bacterium]|nr:serine/threonine protein kinase [Candidatus Melainabacteria bacterium]